MPVESPITDLSSLNETWPLESDLQSATDDHLRLIKDAIKKAFTSLSSAGGVVTVTAAELNFLDGAVSNIQAQIDAASANWRYTTQATENLTSTDKLLVDPAVGGMVISLPNAPLQGTEIQIIDVGGNAAPPNNEVQINRSGVDTIFDVDTWTPGLTTITLNNDGEYRYLVYENASARWFTWTLK